MYSNEEDQFISYNRFILKQLQANNQLNNNNQQQKALSESRLISHSFIQQDPRVRLFFFSLFVVKYSTIY